VIVSTENSGARKVQITFAFNAKSGIQVRRLNNQLDYDRRRRIVGVFTLPLRHCSRVSNHHRRRFAF
jgi:hypothetical protein